jgi:hydrogenase nickel incorporation protein HypA/HybF
MHELSIAMSIIEMVEEESRLRGGLKIVAVHVRLGALSGVAKYPLLFSYETACQNTPLAISHLVIEDVPGVIYCASCDAQRPAESPDWFCCSVCGTLSSELVQGKELEVVSLEVEE